MHLGVETFRNTCQRTMDKLLRMGMPGPEASIIKLHWTELTQAMPQIGMAILGVAGQLYETPVPGARAEMEEWVQAGFLQAPAASIARARKPVRRVSWNASER